MLIIGHRGARREAPENTLSGFRHLRQLGLRAVEFDVQVAQGGELVVIHDPTLERTTNGEGPVCEQSIALLQTLDACHKSHPDWPTSDGVPTLRETMALLHDFDLIQFEIKARSEEHYRGVLHHFPSLWREFGFGARGVLTSIDPRVVEIFRDAEPEIPRGLVCEEEHPDPLGQALALDVQLLCLNWKLATPTLITEAQMNGLHVSVWTVNDADVMEMLATYGVDSVITDVPQLALETLDR